MPTTSVRREFVTDLPLLLRGKVRDTHTLPNPTILLSVATNRVSIFDHVLPAEVELKGQVLTVQNIFWALKLGGHMPRDLVAYGHDIDSYLPGSLRGDTELQKYAIVVKRLNMILVEAVARGYLTGSAWAEYVKTGPNHTVCGHSLPPGLHDGDCLPKPILTPTTKAVNGHDQPIPIQRFREQYGKLGKRIERLALQLFAVASEIALQRGIIIADTKFEFGISPLTGELTLGDERLTPDSSRFWLVSDWKRSRETGISPISFDKQVVREWGKTIGIHKLDPRVPEDVERMQGLTVPQDILARTAHIYRYISYLITGMRLETFQQSTMGVPAILPPVEIIVGGDLDIPQIEQGLDLLRRNQIRFMVRTINCSNRDALRQYAKTVVPENATVIAVAGRETALPGALHAWLRYYDKGHIPVIGVALSGSETSDLIAARLSIERLPGNPVILRDRLAYAEAEGFVAACRHAIEREFFVPESPSREPKF